MGVSKFNIIRDAYGKIMPIHKFKKIIIDASNLFHTYMSAAYSSMCDKYGKYDFGGVKADILTQAADVVSSSFINIRKYLLYLINVYEAENIILVFDPISTPDYIINVVGESECAKYLSSIYPKLEFNSNERKIIHVHMKEEEQTKRRGIDPIALNIEKLNNIEDLTLKNCLINLYSETMLLGSQHNIIILSSALISLVSQSFADSKIVHLYRADGEADLLIKNLAYEDEVDTLIISRDTDYYFLLSEFKWCYCTDLKRNSPVYRPYQIWEDFLGGNFKYDIVIRLSPLLGNDYTAHKSILNSAAYNDILTFLNIDGNFKSLVLKKQNMNVRKLYNVAEKNNLIESIGCSMISCEAIDAMINAYNFDYFKKYFLSIMIYTQWNTYSDYNEIEISQVSIPNKIKKVMHYDLEAYEKCDMTAFIKSCIYETGEDILTNEFTDKIQANLNEFQDYDDGADYFINEDEVDGYDDGADYFDDYE